MAIEFKDTVVASVTYYLTAKQKDLLGAIGYSNVNANRSIKGQWTYIISEEKRKTVIVGDKKKIIVVQTL